MSAPRRKAEAQSWHARSVAAWEKFGEHRAERMRELRKVQAAIMARYVTVRARR